MNTRDHGQISWLLFMSMASIACGTEPAPATERTGMALSIDTDGNTDVAGFAFTINRVACTPGESFAPFSTYAVYDLEDVELSTYIAADGSSHIFSDAFFVLEAGCYDVLAQPINATGSPSADCSPAGANNVVVVAGRTTETVLISQCAAGAGQGGLDVVAVLNHPPRLDTATYDPSKWLPHCHIQTICATFGDPDDDPMDIAWEQIGGIPLASGPAVVSTTTGPDHRVTQCVTLKHGGPGRIDLAITAYDQMADPGGAGLIRFEDYFAMQGISVTSHSRLEILSYGVADDSCDDSGGNDSSGDSGSPSLAFCDNPARVWHFGGGAGLDFSGGTPISIPSPMYTYEGNGAFTCGTEVLVGVNGGTIYDRNGNTMPNGSGLAGGISASQSGLVVPRPGSNGNELFVFTLRDLESGLGPLYYSVVNMSLNGGLGDVDVTQINVALSPNVTMTEKLTSVQHANNVDYWVVGHAYSSNAFYAYLVSATGVSGPIISNAGSYNIDFIQQLKASPDGTRLATAIYSFWQIHGFDRETGIVSELVSVPSPCARQYGVEFSPNGRFLYGSCYDGGNVYQYDLSMLTVPAVSASEVYLGTLTGVNGGALQRGPDGKIYASSWSQSYLSSIDSPNTPGTGAGFTLQSIPISQTLFHGLPHILHGTY